MWVVPASSTKPPDMLPGWFHPRRNQLVTLFQENIRAGELFKLLLPYSREPKHVSISKTPMLLIEIYSISKMGCQK